MATATKDAPAKIVSYIEALPEWSQAICKKLRQIILETDAEITEEWKWGPHYSRNGMVCGFSAFKNHVKLNFFNGSAMKDPKKLFNNGADSAFSRSIDFKSTDALDGTVLKEYIREAIALNESGFKRTLSDKTVVVPDALEKAFDENGKAKNFFETLSYTCKKEYVNYITSAKQEKTINDRIAKVIAHCADEKKGF